MKICWENYKDDFDYWSPDDGDFNCPEGLIFVERGDALLTRRIKPFAEWEVLIKDGRYSKSIGFLVSTDNAEKIKKGVDKYKEEHGTAEERRRKNFERRYSNWKAALSDAAEAMFNLNRYAKYESCTRLHQYTIYTLKNQFIKKLYEKGYAQAVWKQILKSDWLICNHCDGTGFCDRGYCKYGCVGTCSLCKGKGEWLPPDRVYLCFRFEIGNQRYTWHQPDNVLDFSPEFSKPPEDWDGEIEEKPIELQPRQFAEAKSIIRWVLDKMKG